MYWQQPVRRQLLLLALITSPLLAVFRIAPVAMLTQSRMDEIFPAESPSLMLILFAGSFIAITIFALWLINVWLFTRDLEDTEKVRERHSNWQTYALSFALAIVLLLIPRGIEYFLEPSIAFRRPEELSLYPFLGNLANNGVILLILKLVLSRDNENRLALTNMQLEVSNLMAQQAQLKHQLQPHFLFNALYTLQLLIGKKPEQAKDYLQRLSGFLRRSIQYARQDTISVRDELGFCRDYLALQKVRFGEALNYTIDLSEEQQDAGELPIFTLQVLVENAIKHNAFTADEPLHIRISSCGQGRLLVENNMLPKNEGFNTSNGFGLHNLSERYRLLSQLEPTIETSTEELAFRVYVPILTQ